MSEKDAKPSTPPTINNVKRGPASGPFSTGGGNGNGQKGDKRGR